MAATVQIYAGKGFDSQKTLRWFKERRIPFQQIDLGRYGLSPGELQSVARQTGLRALIDQDSKAYKESTLQFLSGEGPIMEALLAAPRYLRAPIVRMGKRASVGYCPEQWQIWLAEDK